MDFQTARSAMVESQIRPNGVRDPEILKAFGAVPRELFVPADQKALAYIDDALPIAPAQAGEPTRYLLPPMTLARLLQFAEPKPADAVLDIGGVTGYSAAILARLTGKVFALEATPALAERARQCLKDAGETRVLVESGRMSAGLSVHNSYDIILLNGAAAKEPRSLFRQLAEGGRLLAIIGHDWFGRAHLFTKTQGVVSGRALFDAGAHTLPGFEAEPQFVF